MSINISLSEWSYQQKLIWASKILCENNFYLFDFRIQNESTIYVTKFALWNASLVVQTFDYSHTTQLTGKDKELNISYSKFIRTQKKWIYSNVTLKSLSSNHLDELAIFVNNFYL